MPNADFTGRRFDHLTVIEKAGRKLHPCGQKKTQYLCRCDCGKELVVTSADLRSGKTRSCGGKRVELWKKTHSNNGGVDEIEGYINLANAIIHLAARDYQSAYRMVLMNPNSKEARRRYNEERKFFNSPWYGALTTYDGEDLMEQLEKEINRKQLGRRKYERK